MAREQEAVALNQARNAQRDSEEARKANIEDLAKLGRAISRSCLCSACRSGR
jgi:hypothetical protein